MDLISREAAIEAVKIPDDGCNNPSERHGIIFARVEARRAIQSIPSVPAVPLDKLCEYLNSVIYPCIICKESPSPQCNAKRKGCWKQVLTRWMEEQNDG